MEESFLPYFRHIFPRLLVWLAVPFYMGLQISAVAQEERRVRHDYSAGSYALDAIGLFFSVALPAFMLLYSLAAYKLSATHAEALSIIFRYVVMFFFLGIWWQVFIIMSIKAYRDRGRELNRAKYIGLYVFLSIALSLNAFLGGEWFLKWGSMFFFALGAPFLVLPAQKMSRAYLVLAVLGLALQTIGFIYASAIV